MLAVNVLNSKIQNQDLYLPPTPAHLPHSRHLSMVLYFPRQPDLKTLSFRGFLLLPYSLHWLSFQVMETMLLITPHIYPFAFIPTAMSLVLGTISSNRLHVMPSVLHTLIHPTSSTLTFPATPNHWPPSQGPFSGVLHLCLTICPCVPPLGSNKSKYFFYCFSSWQSAALQISSVLSHRFF